MNASGDLLDDFEENLLKRERQRKQQTQQDVEEMRLQLPQYNLKDIRQHKLPYFEALLLELEEDGYINTAGYLQEIFTLQETLRVEKGPQSKFWQYPVLQRSNHELKTLSDALIAAEMEHNKQNYQNETEILLKNAINFCLKSKVWFWLGEQLLLQCISNATEYKISDGKYEAIARYIYGKLLIEKVQDFETAEQHLEISRTLSIGKSWTAKQFISESDGSSTIFMRANYFLHFCCMRQAQQWSKIDSEQAIEYAILASKRAVDACYHEGQTEALVLKGKCALDVNNTEEAISTFTKAYYIQKKNNNIKAMSEAEVQLARAYLIHGNSTLALKHLHHLKEMAEAHNLQFYLAQAYRYLGEHYLVNGQASLATPLLSNALNMFHGSNAIIEANQVRNLGAVSVGLELLPTFVSILTKTDSRKYTNWYENLLKLIYWKESREPFWIKSPEISSQELEMTESAESNGQEQRDGEETMDNDSNEKIESESVLFVHEEYGSRARMTMNDNKIPIEKKIEVIFEQERNPPTENGANENEAVDGKEE